MKNALGQSNHIELLFRFDSKKKGQEKESLKP